jgi:thiosulfate/3-mercaptopyruvate sulfurtransferase
MTHRSLVTTAELAQHLHDPAWVVIDCRHELADPLAGRIEYRRSHIVGARFMGADEDLAAPVTGSNGRHPLPDVDVFAERLGRAGIDSGIQVVAYDAQAATFASRLWWMVRWLGHEAVAVLDGGWNKWTAESRPVSAEVPAPATARFVPSVRSVSVDAQAVLSALGKPGTLLLDARAPDRFRGENETLDPVGGRIPGAANRFFKENLSGACFKSAETLRTEYASLLAGRSAQELVHYCGSGVSACHNLLAMEIAGLHGGRLYAGSWSEWCADPSRPRAAG